ncbi:transcription antitermination factor NusB [Psychromarinibacter sp. C21-152]|uniref:Transcription antitermination factor NusB n=1 Tax=Psychromarinibacter sediminicola TaxID=3033385 RepID=A0AAE3T8V6_9RHOB|nr:transcription antitermination factor NusB [Psychromarinibacter sediminicola]MDF0601820.1 transcription antitermination factor NusB [Psychromarinibacter sediminicola]
MARPGLAPRRAALRLIGRVTEDGRLLSELLPRAVEQLSPDERARTQRLATETLRWADRADRLLGPHLRKKPAMPVLNALRLGVVEMAVEGAAAHGVVDACVSLVREDRKTASAAGLVNAVLRRVELAKWDTLPPPRLPKWLRGALVAAWGKETVARIEAAHAAGAPLDLTPKDGDAAALAARVAGTALPTGSVRLGARAQISALPGYDSGDWWVQDAAAAVPARVLAARPGERVLDLCAAPGGKTLQLAATGAEVTALDISAARMARVTENLARTGLSADAVTADALDWEPPAPFDAILLDAPCSATGTIRRHPDLPHAKDGGDFPALFALQAALIDRAAAMLRPGGRLVFCTCSLLPDEGEVQVEEALARHPDLTLDADALRLPGIEPAWIGAEGLRLRPDLWEDAGGLDGFFVAMLRKAA